MLSTDDSNVLFSGSLLVMFWPLTRCLYPGLLMIDLARLDDVLFDILSTDPAGLLMIAMFCFHYAVY